jgi:hypothetical protein
MATKKATAGDNPYRSPRKAEPTNDVHRRTVVPILIFLLSALGAVLMELLFWFLYARHFFGLF